MTVNGSRTPFSGNATVFLVSTDGQVTDTLPSDHKTRTATRPILKPHRTAMPLGNRLDEREPESHAASTLTGPWQTEEGFKDPIPVFGRNPRATITHTQNRGAVLA